MPRCVAIGCNENGSHCFPKDAHLRKLWEIATKIENFRANNNSRLCSKHFAETDYHERCPINIPGCPELQQKKYLRKGAIPTIFLQTKPSKRRVKERKKRKTKRSDSKQFYPVEVKIESFEDATPCVNEEQEKITLNQTLKKNVLQRKRKVSPGIDDSYKRRKFREKMCRICLSSSSKLLSLESYGLSGAYEQLTGVSLEHDDGLPRELCVECATLLDKYHKFRDKSIRGDKLLRKIYYEYKSVQPSEGIRNKINNFQKIKISNLDFSQEMASIDIPPERNETLQNHSDIDLDTSFIDKEELDIEPMDTKDVVNDKANEVCIKQEVEYDAEEHCHDPLSLNSNIETYDDNIIRVHFTVTKLNIREQIQVHNKEEGDLLSEYKCDVCNKRCDSADTLKTHLDEHDTKRGKIVCLICKCRFNQISELKSHASVTHLYRYRCLTCRKTAHSRKAALRHFETHKRTRHSLDY